MNGSLEDTIAATLKRGMEANLDFVPDYIVVLAYDVAVAVREWEASRELSDEEVEAAALAMYGDPEWGRETTAYIKAERVRARVALRAAYRIRGETKT